MSFARTLGVSHLHSKLFLKKSVFCSISGVDSSSTRCYVLLNMSKKPAKLRTVNIPASDFELAQRIAKAMNLTTSAVLDDAVAIGMEAILNAIKKQAEKDNGNETVGAEGEAGGASETTGTSGTVED